jgi:uncharacterized protein (DUF58 family)
MRGARPPLWLGRGGYVLLAASAVVAGVLSVPLGWPLAVAATLGFCIGAVTIEAWRDRRALDVRRLPPPRLVLGHETALRVRVSNRGTRPLHVGVVEAPVERVRVAEGEARAIVAAGAAPELSIACTPYERGEVAFTATYAWFEAGWRLVRHRRRIDDVVGARVFPDVPAFDAADDLALRARLTAAGARRLRRRGGGSEFAGFRQYLPGDAFRDIDWKATARRGHLVVAEHEVERRQQIGLVIDAGRMMAARVDGRRKLDIAISAALGIASFAQAAGDRVGVHAFAGGTLARVAPRAGRDVPAAILAALAGVEPCADEPDYERAVLELERTYRKRSLIVVFTDLFDPVASATLLGVLALLVRRHVVIVALTNDGVLDAAVADDAPGNATRRAVARSLAGERAAAVATLRARGIIAIDVAATALRPAVLDAYVAIKQRSAL